MATMMDTNFKSQILTDLAALNNRRVTEGRADQPFNLDDLLEYYEAIGRVDLSTGIRRKMLEARIAFLLAVPPEPTVVKTGAATIQGDN